MIAYLKELGKYVKKLKGFHIQKIPREENGMADYIAKLASDPEALMP